MDGISRSRGWDKEIPHGVLPMEQLVLSDKWARKPYSKFHLGRYIDGYTVENLVLLKLNFRPYIRRYTSPKKLNTVIP